MSSEVERLLQAEAAWLRERSPLEEMAPQALTALLARASLAFYPRGADIVHPDTAVPAGRLFILKSGTASLRRSVGDAPEDVLTLEAGALFSLESLLASRVPGHVVSAEEDCRCWVLEGDDAWHLVSERSALRNLLETAWGAQEELSKRHAADAQSRRVAEQVLCLSLDSVLAKQPVTMAPEGTVGDALQLMVERGAGSVVVTEGGAPRGIVTGSHLLRHVFARGQGTELPVTQAMATPVFSLPGSATVAEAALEMGARSIRHIVVASGEGEAAGVVSERDLFELQRHGLRQISEPVEAARSVEDIVAVAARFRQTGRAMLQQGMGAAQLTRLVSSFNDRIAHRLIELSKPEAVADIDFCWLAFGSEGRQEQTFITDQDNGLIFQPAPGVDPESVRPALVDFAGQVNAALDRCGFSLCDGGVMAMNPKWCLTRTEWQKRFTDWILTPSPEALLNASIFFDFRALYGNHALVEALRDHLFSVSRENTIFLRMMAQNALEVSPPLGMFSRFSTDGGAFSGTIDIKKQGSRLFVDGARILSLAKGVRATSTEQRLRLGGKRIRRSGQAVEADVSAFQFIQGLRLRLPGDRPHQAHAHANRLDPRSLNEFDQRMLREAFRQAQHLQERIKLDFMP